MKPTQSAPGDAEAVQTLKPWWKRKRFAIPLGALVAFVALVTVINLTMSDEDRARFEAERVAAQEAKAAEEAAQAEAEEAARAEAEAAEAAAEAEAEAAALQAEADKKAAEEQAAKEAEERAQAQAEAKAAEEAAASEAAAASEIETFKDQILLNFPSGSWSDIVIAQADLSGDFITVEKVQGDTVFLQVQASLIEDEKVALGKWMFNMSGMDEYRVFVVADTSGIDQNVYCGRDSRVCATSIWGT